MNINYFTVLLGLLCLVYNEIGKDITQEKWVTGKNNLDGKITLLFRRIKEKRLAEVNARLYRYSKVYSLVVFVLVLVVSITFQSGPLFLIAGSAFFLSGLAQERLTNSKQ
jgi:hypothetical protein